ncbi:unnamed protein product, partial [Effrenium voratum]
AVEHTYEYTSISIGLRQIGLGDADAASLALSLRSFLARNVDPKLPVQVDLDASDNDLGDAAAAGLLEALRGCQLRSVKLYKNRVSNQSCSALASLLWEQKEPCEEIHLSHNEIDHRGVATLLAVLAMHGAYPRTVEHLEEAIPAWLRLEQNQATSIDHLLSVLQKEMPHVHLFGIGKQKDLPDLPELPQLESMALAVADSVVAGKFEAKVELPLAVSIPATPAAPAEPVCTRTVQLRVDPAAR